MSLNGPVDAGQPANRHFENGINFNVKLVSLLNNPMRQRGFSTILNLIESVNVQIYLSFHGEIRVNLASINRITTARRIYDH